MFRYDKQSFRSLLKSKKKEIIFWLQKSLLQKPPPPLFYSHIYLLNNIVRIGQGLFLVILPLFRHYYSPLLPFSSSSSFYLAADIFFYSV